MKFVLDPFYLLLFFYLTINTIFSIIGFNINYVEFEFSKFYIRGEYFLSALLFQFFWCFVLFLLYYFFSKFKNIESDYLSSKYGYSLAILQILFFLYNYIYGTNVAGSTTVATNQILNVFFVLVPADILFFLLGVQLKSNKLFYLNAIIYLFSSVSRGWMGGVFILLILFLCRKEGLVVSLKSLLRYLFLIFLLILILPYLLQFKWVFRTNGSIIDALDVVEEQGYLKLLFESIEYTFSRFQHNYHVALYLQNNDILNMKYNNNEILPYWAEGVFQAIVLNLCDIRLPSLGNSIATLFFSSQDGAWNANPGLSGWFVVLNEKFIFFFFYIFILLCFGFYFSIKFFNKKMLMTLGVFSILYLFHGWIGIYVTMITYLIFFAFVRKVKI